jgi:hypothetical protein
MLRVLKLDPSVYAEIERDPDGTHQAAWVVGLVATGAAFGTVMLTSWKQWAILGAVMAALIHWLLWSGLEVVIGRMLFGRQVSGERHIRTLGYAQTPQLFAFFAFVPVVGPWLVLGSRVLTMFAGSQALRASLELHRREALAIRFVSFVAAVAIATGVRAVLGDVPFLAALLRP